MSSNYIKKIKYQEYNTIIKSYKRKEFIRTKSFEEILIRSFDDYVEKMLPFYKYKYKRKYDVTEKVCVVHIVSIV